MPVHVMKPVLIPLMLFAGLVFSGDLAAQDGDPIAGKLKSSTCLGCHGIPGYNNVYPTYKVPKLGGQNYEYLVSALTAYRDGQRNHGTMELQASSLSDQDMKDVAAYFATFALDN